MTIALAGVDCREFFTLMTSFFGQCTEFQEDPFNYLDGAPAVWLPLDLTDTDMDDEQEEALSTTDTPGQEAATPVTSTSVPAAPVVPHEPKVKSKLKARYIDRCTDIADTQGFFPVNPASLHNTGFPEQYLVKPCGSSSKGQSIYLCPYGDACTWPPYSGDLPSTGSHVCRHHLGLCLLCPYEGLRFYNGDGWRKHMQGHHSSTPWYRSQLSTPISLLSDPLGPAIQAVEVVSTVAPPTPFSDEPPPPDTLPFVQDTADQPLEEAETTEPDLLDPTQPAGIDSFSIWDDGAFRVYIRFMAGSDVITLS